MRKTISLCVIAKDEEAMLPHLLASVAGAVDEVVVVDGGSTDRTVELARAAGARVHERPWTGDFAAARNAALAHAHGDFVLVLDADERLAPGAAAALRRAVKGATWDCGLLPLHNATHLLAEPREVLSGEARDGSPQLLPRLLRNAGGLAWTGIVHETVAPWLHARGSRAARIPCDIVHYGHVPALREKLGKRERNLALLRRQCALDPSDVIALGYLAGELLDAGKLEEAAAVTDRAWAFPDAHWGHLSMHRLAAVRGILALRAGDPARAIEAANRGEAQMRGHSDWHYLRGCAREQQALAAPTGSTVRRELALRAASELTSAYALRDAEQLEQFVSGADGSAAVLRRGHALLLAGKPGDAMEVFDALLAADPADRPARLGRAEALLDLGEPARALEAAAELLDGAPDGWTLAAAAARALGATADSELFATRARERQGTRFAALHRRERLDALADGPGRAFPAPGGSAPLPTQLHVGADGERFAVTVISPPGYAHSAAFAELAETLVYGLRALGHDAVPSTDPGLGDRRHIVLGANLVPRTGVRLLPGSILYNLEQVQEDSAWLTPELLDLYRRFPLWDYSDANADALVRMGVPRPQVVPVGYAPVLTRIEPATESHDVLFYGSMNARRQAVLEDLARRGARVHAAFGVYGEERDRLVARARIVLNVHFYEARVFEIVRASYLLANRRLVVSERGCDAAEEAAFEEGIAFAPYDRLADRCLELLRSPEERRRIADAGFRAIAARPIEPHLRNVVAALRRG